MVFLGRPCCLLLHPPTHTNWPLALPAGVAVFGSHAWAEVEPWQRRRGTTCQQLRVNRSKKNRNQAARCSQKPHSHDALKISNRLALGSNLISYLVVLRKLPLYWVYSWCNKKQPEAPQSCCRESWSRVMLKAFGSNLGF